MSTSIINTLDDLVPFYRPELNNGLNLKDPNIARLQDLNWYCTKGHKFTAHLASMLRRQSPCQDCRRIQYDLENTLEKKFPRIFKQLHPSKNKNINFTAIKWRDERKVWWKCIRGHEYLTTVYTRTALGTSCPFCKNPFTTLELRLYAEFKFIFEKVELRAKFKGKEIDVLVSDINLGIEIDGYRWHKSKIVSDQAKNKVIKKLGMKLIRIREARLIQLEPYDISIKSFSQANQKIAVSSLAKYILNNFKLSSTQTKKLTFLSEGHGWNDNDSYLKLRANLPAPLEGTSFKEEHPEKAKMWDHKKNYPLVPESFRSQAHDKVWFICPEEHSFHKRIQNVTLSNHTGCPECSQKFKSELQINKVLKKGRSLAIAFPDKAKWWHSKLNNKNPFQVTALSRESYWWKCPKGHEFENPIVSMTANDHGCPYCSNNRIGYGNSLADEHPKIAKTWHKSKNGNLTAKDVVSKSGKVVWWCCERDHTWQQQVRNRVEKGLDGCMVCRSIVIKFPRIASEIHSSKNEGLVPTELFPFSIKRVWWKCIKCQSEWKARVGHRTQGKANCPKCTKEKLKTNRMEKLSFDQSIFGKYPDSKLLWDYNKNSKINGKNLSPHSGEIVWWQCPENHSFQQKIIDVCRRKNLLYCPVCKRSYGKTHFR